MRPWRARAPAARAARAVRGLAAHNCELDGIAAHPSAPEIATCSDDRTLRVWDLALKQQIKIRMLKFAGKSCAYSPDGKLIAVGLANGGWLVVDAEVRLPK